MNGRLPNPLPLKLHQITFTPHPEASFSALMHLSIYDNETKLYRSKATSKFSFAFRMPINVSADITIRMETRRGKVLLEFSFHTGFMTPGLIRVTRNDLDQEGAGAYDSMDLVFSDFSDEDEGIQLRGQSYTKYLDTQLNKCLVRLVNNHRLRVQKPDVSRLLRDHAVDKEVACFALQVHGNNFDATRGWLQRYGARAELAGGPARRGSPPRAGRSGTALLASGSRRSEAVGAAKPGPAVTRSDSTSSRRSDSRRDRSDAGTSSASQKLEMLLSGAEEGKEEEEQTPLQKLDELMRKAAPSQTRTDSRSTRRVESDRRKESAARGATGDSEDRGSSRSLAASEGRRPSVSGSQASENDTITPPDIDSLLQKLRTRRKSPAGISTAESRVHPEIASAPLESVEILPIQGRRPSDASQGMSSSRRPSDASQGMSSRRPSDAGQVLSSSPSPPPSTGQASTAGSRSGSKLDLLIDQIEGWDVEEEDDDWIEPDSVSPAKGTFLSELGNAVKPFYTEVTQVPRASIILLQDLPQPPAAPVAPPAPPAPSTNQPTASPNGKYVNLVPLPRANNICITLSRFTRVLRANGGGDGIHSTSHTLLGAVLDLDDTILAELDDLKALRRILPTEREVELFTAYTGKVKMLAPAETWLRMCVVRFPGTELANMVDAFAFRAGVLCEHVLQEIMDGCDRFVDVCEGICTSDRLKGLLRCLFSVRRCSDEDFARFGPESFKAWMGKDARALGLGVDGLAGVTRVGSADGAWRLLDFLVGVCWGTQIEILDVLGDFPGLPQVAQADVTDFCLVYHENVAELERLKGLSYPREFAEVINPFFRTMEETLRHVDESLKDVERVFCSTAEYLGEDLSGYYGILSAPSLDDELADDDRRTLPMEMFVKLDEFFREFSSAAQARKGS